MMDHWDRKTQTVLPEDMVKKAIEVHKKYPDKRLVIHFVKPHLPYIGEKAAAMRKQLGRPPGGYNPNQDHLDVEKRISNKSISILSTKIMWILQPQIYGKLIVKV